MCGVYTVNIVLFSALEMNKITIIMIRQDSERLLQLSQGKVSDVTIDSLGRFIKELFTNSSVKP